MSFVEELKRRNVFRVGIAYVVVAWLVLQVADVVFDAIGSPDWVMKTLLVILAIGLVFAIIFAWAFELTPEGIKREHQVDRATSITHTTGRKLDRVIIGVLVLALGYFAWDKFLRGEQPTMAGVENVPSVTESSPDSTPEAELEKSIAVLPFVNMSADTDNEYFSDGLSEELLNLLAKVDGLKVAARTSSFKFKGAEAGIDEIGQALNVATILEGSVRKSGNQARITAQLIKVDDGFHLWSETYDRELDNIFEVQDEIASAIVDALKLPLLGTEDTAVASHATASFEAYDLYLLGRHHLRQINAESFHRAADFFTRAVALDENYAPAWAGLAEAYMGQADYGGLGMNEAIELSSAALDRAQAIAPEMAEARNARAILLSYQGRRADAQKEAEAVLATDPDNIDAIHNLASALGTSDPERTAELADRAMALDPLSENSRQLAVWGAYSRGGYASAEGLLRKLLIDEPDNPGLYESWATLAGSRGKTDIAIEKMTRVHELRPGDTFPAMQVMFYHLQVGDRETAATWRDRAIERGPQTRWSMISRSAIRYYDGNLETLATELNDQVQNSPNVVPGILEFHAQVLARLGRPEDARHQVRRAVDMFSDSASDVPSDEEADASALLALLLEDGPERQRLIDRVREREQHLRTHFPEEPSGPFQSAVIASLENRRDDMYAAFDEFVEHDGHGATWIQANPIFAQWHDDPMFREVIGRINASSRAMREKIAAAQTDMTASG